MNSETYLILTVIIAGLFLIYTFLSRKLEKNKTDDTLISWLKSMQDNLQSNNQNITSTLQKSYADLHLRLDKATSVMADLKREAGSFTEIGRGMRELQDFLKSPKLRGNIGEQVLKDLISQMFPKSSFHLQYAFKSGQIVDAAIKTDAGILPIDSKFPMENFTKMMKEDNKNFRSGHKQAFIRDVRKHIRDISSKYILPNEGTMDFALMYIPSEPVYYEIANEVEILEYARQNRVYPVSPTTLYAHLQTILLSFEGKKIETKSKQVFALLRTIQNDYGRLEENLSLVNKHLNNAQSQLNNTTQNFNKLGQKINSTQYLDQGS
jgi:DNA recombination protein RmuC